MNPTLPGIHHVTAITGDAQRNIDFYTGVLGLRLVKVTVNFDGPTAYHLYYGDELGRPGTAMTFFAWNNVKEGRVGPPQVITTIFAVPDRALDFWADRLKEQRVAFSPLEPQLGEEGLAFSDPDGMPLEIVATNSPGGETPQAGPIPPAHAIRGFHGIRIAEEHGQQTVALLTDIMHFTEEAKENGRTRYRADGSSFASVVDVVEAPKMHCGISGAGTVHHVAFRTPDTDELKAWRETIQAQRLRVSDVIDRHYFHSIYFHEPGGVLFEIATCGPGFTVDEPPDTLGQTLQLPPWMEADRSELMKSLPPLQLPEW